MKKQANTLIVFFNLKDDVNESEYLSWAKNTDLPTVNKLNSVNSFEVFKGISIFGDQKESPWDYFEVFKVHSEDTFLTEIQTDVMSKVVEQFQVFVKDATFISTQDITTL